MSECVAAHFANGYFLLCKWWTLRLIPYSLCNAVQVDDKIIQFSLTDLIRQIFCISNWSKDISKGYITKFQIYLMGSKMIFSNTKFKILIFIFVVDNGRFTHSDRFTKKTSGLRIGDLLLWMLLSRGKHFIPSNSNLSPFDVNSLI